MTELTPVHLVGEHAELVPMQEAHAAGLLESVREPGMWSYMPIKPLLTIADAHEFVGAALAAQDAGTALPFTIVNRKTVGIVGSSRITEILPVHRQGEIGWTWLDASARRTGINTECKYLLLRHCFESLEFVRVQLKADARNIVSLRAMERIGAIREGTLRHHRILPDGYLRDSVYYSVIATEWSQTKAHLERLLDR